VKNILIINGLDPEPDMTIRSTWHEFIRSYWKGNHNFDICYLIFDLKKALSEDRAFYFKNS